MRRKYNDGWEFLKLPYESDIDMMYGNVEGFVAVDIPHDYLIYDSKKLYEDSRGWYKKLAIIDRNKDERVFLYFEGVYMDSQVYVNGGLAAEWKYGYSSFEVEVTPYLKDDVRDENEIVVVATNKSPNTRWYSGAGVYRDVWIKVVPETYIVTDSMYVSTKKGDGDIWTVSLEAEVAGSHADEVGVEFIIRHNGTLVKRQPASQSTRMSDGRCLKSAQVTVENPSIWDISSTNLYKLMVCIKHDNAQNLDNPIMDMENAVNTKQNIDNVDTIIEGHVDTIDGRSWVVDTECAIFGFRTTEFLPDEGFFLNGRHVKLNGVCEHHDLGSLGSAYSSAAMRRKFVILKEMGVNALRTSHNMPAPDVMRLADEMGILVISEAFDMWERPKTTYDYARFFKDWAARDVASWIRRDRNHPSLIMWSIGNEIYDTHADERGQEVTRMLAGMVREHDRHVNAPVTIGSNYMPWENAQKCADIVKIAGYNYAEKYYEEHHEAHPDWVIYGSETASVVHSRGIYHFPLEQSMLSDEDEQCSALGNTSTSWGARSISHCISDDRDAKFSMGQFIWTGWDYIGEPTPYHTKNSYFGQIDTAGFPKDSYYVFKAEWTYYKDSPMVHIYPYWDFSEGQIIDVCITSNAPSVELFVNGSSLGIREIDHENDKNLVATWKVPYVGGEIKALAYDEEGIIIAEDCRHSFSDSEKIILKPDKTVMKADGLDLIFVEISTVDKDGYPVENAADYVEVLVTGAGRLVGLDNGDSTDYDSYKGTIRKLFSGKLLAVIAAKCKVGYIHVAVNGKGLASAELTLQAVDISCQTESGSDKGDALDCVSRGISCQTENRPAEGETLDGKPIWIRKIDIKTNDGQRFDADKRSIAVEAVIYPKNADIRDVTWSTVYAGGVISPISAVEGDGLRATVTARADGEFYVRCTTDNGTGKVKLMSQLEFKSEGIGRPFFDPYGFVSGILYSRVDGEVTNGNENGFATARDGRSIIEFADIDFGDFGSDVMTLPVFSFNAPCVIELWENMAYEEGSVKLADLAYNKPYIWNTYQEETYKLPRRLRGVTSISFVLYHKAHIKGFSFARCEKAFARLRGCDNDGLYGDSFTPCGDNIENIGNNVSIEYLDMDFGTSGTNKVAICGRTPLAANTIHIRFEEDGVIENQIVEFPQSAEYVSREFDLADVRGKKKVLFVFLPGSNFDFGWCEFGVRPS